MIPALVIGSGGQVASALVRSLLARRREVVQTSSSGKPGALPLNLDNPASIKALFDSLGPQKFEVFLPGALTHVDRCEEEPDLCFRINELGPGLVAEECARRGFPLVYFSTEYVFGQAEYEGGALGPFSEEDPPAPTSWYGHCKLGAERRIQATLGAEAALIVRTTMVFSWDPKGMNFLMQYVRHLEEIKAGKNPAEFRVPEDQISTPTYAAALAEASCFLREKGVGGVMNVVGSDCLSRRELVERVISVFGFERDRSLAGFRFLKTAELGQKARRPLTAGLTVEKAQRLGVKIFSLGEALADAKAKRNEI